METLGWTISPFLLVMDNLTFPSLKENAAYMHAVIWHKNFIFNKTIALSTLWNSKLNKKTG